MAHSWTCKGNRNSNARPKRETHFDSARSCFPRGSIAGAEAKHSRLNFGESHLSSLTTSHIERAFLSVRQEVKRFQRKGLGYSKDLEMHKAAVALHFGIYNFVRVHKTLGTTPAVAAGVELERWSLERVVEMTAEYLRRREDAQFEQAFAKAGI